MYLFIWVLPMFESRYQKIRSIKFFLYTFKCELEYTEFDSIEKEASLIARSWSTDLIGLIDWFYFPDWRKVTHIPYSIAGYECFIYMKIFAEFALLNSLLSMRQQAGLTQNKLAERMGTLKVTFLDWENSNPNWKTLKIRACPWFWYLHYFIE